MATGSDSSNQLYPFSTEDNKTIPLDVIRPVALFKLDISASGISSITIPSGWKVASFYSPGGCFVQFVAATLTNPLVSNIAHATTLFIPPGCIVTSTVLEGAGKVIPLSGSSTYLVAQQIQKWAGVALQRQLSNI